MKEKNRIFLVEDDLSFGSVLKAYLEIHKYEIEWIKDGKDAINTFENGQFDICILDVMLPHIDGFQLAEEDLKLRGPGEFFGTRQSGLPDIRMAKLSDVELLELARSEAIRLFQIDPGLEKTEQHLLAKELARVWQQGAAEWS